MIGRASDPGERRAERIVGRYALLGEIASGGMATVHFGRLLGPVGFSRMVAIKRLHPQYAKDPEFVAMLLDEARLATRVQHPNVVSTLDIVALDGELLLVLDYVHGESLSRLLQLTRAAGRPIPRSVLAAVASGMLHGLHAAHEARSASGEPLQLVHRDVSPQNVLVGVDGVARVLDFGIAKAAGRVQQTREGQLKGKLPYMSPEQVRGAPLDRRSDVYSASIVLWEALTGQRLFHGDNEAVVFAQVALGTGRRPSEVVPDVPEAFDAIVMRGLAREPDDRYATAWDMAVAIEEAFGLASPRLVGAWVVELADELLAARDAQVKEVESMPAHPLPAPAESAAGEPMRRSMASLPTLRRELPVSTTHANRDGGPSEGPPSPPATRSDVIQPFVEPVVRPRSALVLVALAALVLASVGGVVSLSRAREPSPTSPSTSSPASPSSLPVPPATTDSAPAPSAPSTPAAPVAASSTPTRASTRTATPRPPQPPTRPAAQCNPPFLIDEAGIRRIKPECL